MFTLQSQLCSNAFNLFMEEPEKTDFLTDEQLYEHINKVINDYSGLIHQLETAIGVLIVGRKIGWKPLYLVHSIASITKYQKILGLNFKNQMKEVDVKGEKLIGWQIAKSVSNFWKLVSGQLAEPKRTKDWQNLE